LAAFYALHCSLRNLVWTAQKRTRFGSQRIRFCAYVINTPDEGMRHRRTTLRVFFLSGNFLCAAGLLLQAQATAAEPVTPGRQE
jgi:ribose/xylose/arabinose/galactoside ABC-type transport system permease subunit